MERQLNGDYLFGDRSAFAVEVGIDLPPSRGSVLWGHLCLWCQGVALGNLNDPNCWLDGSVHGLRWRADHLADHWDGRLAGVLLEVGPWDHLPHWGAKLRFWESWGEPFDGYTAFLMAPPAAPLRVFYELPDGRRGVATVARESFVATTRQFVNWFGRLPVRP